jgi:hypothetical protein
VTITIAAPGVVTWNGHGFAADQPVVFNTTGALPTGLLPGVVYYVKAPAANTFQLAATPGGAAINTSGAQSGTHTGLETLTPANQKLGYGAGLLMQVGSFFRNVTGMNCEGHGVYGLSGYPGADVAINCNGATLINCAGYLCGGSGRATFGVDSNNISFHGGGGYQCGGHADYENGFLGNLRTAPIWEGCAAGGIRFGDITRANTVHQAYCEQAGNTVVQFDAGGAGKNTVTFGTTGTPGAATVVDNTASQDNDIKIGNVWLKLRLGTGGVFSFAGNTLLVQGGEIQLQDNPVTSNWFLKNVAGVPTFTAGGQFYLQVTGTGLNVPAGTGYKVNGTQVVGAQGAAVADPAAITSADGVNAVAAPTQAEFNALVAEFNKLRADFISDRASLVAANARLRAHGLYT